MANKMTAWITTIIGALLVLQAANYAIPYTAWLVGLGWLAIGISKMTRIRK